MCAVGGARGLRPAPGQRGGKAPARSGSLRGVAPLRVSSPACHRCRAPTEGQDAAAPPGAAARPSALGGKSESAALVQPRPLGPTGRPRPVPAAPQRRAAPPRRNAPSRVSAALRGRGLLPFKSSSALGYASFVVAFLLPASPPPPHPPPPPACICWTLASAGHARRVLTGAGRGGRAPSPRWAWPGPTTLGG